MIFILDWILVDLMPFTTVIDSKIRPNGIEIGWKYIKYTTGINFYHLSQ